MSYEELRQVLGFEVPDDILRTSLTHRSFAYEHEGTESNERLEFLGDAVLGIIITDELFRSHPSEPEGQLAKFRAFIVNARALAGLARSINLGDYLLLGIGEERTDGRNKASILADAMEAIIGALFIAAGIDKTREFVLRIFGDVIQEAPTLGAGLDWKTSLQELCSEFALPVPTYQVQDTGPDHEKSFTAQVEVAGVQFGNGFGRSKKEAEQQAAQIAFETLAAQYRNA